jgi:hypothetical protein
MKVIEDYSEVYMRITALQKLLYSKVIKADFKAAAGYANEIEITAKLLKQTLLNMESEKSK